MQGKSFKIYGITAWWGNGDPFCFVTAEHRPRSDSDCSAESAASLEDFQFNGVERGLDEIDKMMNKSRPTRAEMLGLEVLIICVLFDLFVFIVEELN